MHCFLLSAFCLTDIVVVRFAFVHLIKLALLFYFFCDGKNCNEQICLMVCVCVFLGCLLLLNGVVICKYHMQIYLWYALCNVQTLTMFNEFFMKLSTLKNWLFLFFFCSFAFEFEISCRFVEISAALLSVIIHLIAFILIKCSFSVI